MKTRRALAELRSDAQVAWASSATAPPAVEVAGVRKAYGETVALDGVSLEVRAGEVACVLGRNGAGKTTLVSLVCGLLRPDAGSIAVAGRSVRAWDDRLRRGLGVAPQELGLYPALTVEENLRGFASFYGIRGPRVAERVRAVAADLDLVELLHRPCHQLSGGEKRRLHTAIALVHDPHVVLLDEPTAGVDVQSRAHLLDVVRRLAAEGKAVVYSTHYLHEVEELGARVVILDHGRVIAAGPVGDLVSRHGESFVELAFDAAVPPLDWDGAEHDAGRGTVRVRCADPRGAVPALLASLGPHAGTVRSIEIVKPSLENVFIALTGERFGEPTPEATP